MNPVSEEASKVAATTVEALKQTPAVLALVVFNVIFMGAVIYLGTRTGTQYEAEMNRMHELIAKVMATCGPKQP